MLAPCNTQSLFQRKALQTPHLGFPGGAVVGTCLPLQESQVRSLGQEDPLEKGMATRSSIFCLVNSMDRGAWWATVQGVSKSLTQHTETTLW